MATHQTTVFSYGIKSKSRSTPNVLGSVPLNMVTPGEDITVQSIRGKDDTRRFLESLGFVENAVISVVTELGGNVIVNVKGTRVAISKVMASRVYVN